MRGFGIEHVAVRLAFVAVRPVQRHIVCGRVRRRGQRQNRRGGCRECG
ncbi:protein of unknown function [Ruminococcaceae bacterium BL-4]|nr:protein of unknown function [Ruminococcaceae bacterium BL-4]